MLGVAALYSMFLILFKGATSLRDVKLLVNPPTVTKGSTAAFICSRDMQGAPLYTVKWYRGNHEFYRYTPLHDKPMQVFGLPGISVDLNNSNGSQVVIKRMDLSLAGNFTCEVTADSTFATQIATKYVDVIALPTSPPLLKTDKDRYEPGEKLHANCTSAPSRPAANLTIKINDEPIRSSEMSLHPSESGLLWRSVSAELPVTAEMFVGGRLRVACAATVHHLYDQRDTLDFFTPDTDPRPERITLNGGASKTFQSWILLFLLFLLPMMAMGQNYDFESFDYNSVYDEENHHNIGLSLVGG